MTDIATPEEVAERLALELSIIIWGNDPVATAGDIKRLIEPALTRRFASAISALKDENEMLREALTEAAEYLDGEGYYSEAGKYRAALAQTEPGAPDA